MYILKNPNSKGAVNHLYISDVGLKISEIYNFMSVPAS